MMFKRLALVLFALLMLAPVTLHAQDGATPVYSVTFGVRLSADRVATLYSDGTWRINDLPEQTVFEQMDLQLATPVWSADGRTLYLVMFDDPPGQGKYLTSRPNAIFSYDIESGAFTRRLTGIKPDGSSWNLVAIRLDQLSPDERYAWATRYTFDPLLFDLETGRVVAEIECPAVPLGWLENEVIVGITDALGGQCDPAVYALDLATGATTRPLPPLADSYDSDFLHHTWDGLLLDDGRVLVGPVHDQWTIEVGVLDLDAGSSTHFGRADKLLLADSQRFAVLLVDRSDGYALLRIDLDTLTSEPVGNTLLPDAVHLDGDTLVFWEQVGDGETVTIQRVEHTVDTRIETPFYQGPAAAEVAASPDGAYLAVALHPIDGDKYAQVYSADGLVWAGQNTGGLAALGRYWEMTWSADSAWLHLTPTGDPAGTFSVQPRTGTILSPPAPRAEIVSESPDGAWWVYAILGEQYEVPEDAVLLLQPETGEVVTLAEGVLLEQRNFHYLPKEYYVWSDFVQ